MYWLGIMDSIRRSPSVTSCLRYLQYFQCGRGSCFSYSAFLFSSCSSCFSQFSPSCSSSPLSSPHFDRTPHGNAVPFFTGTPVVFYWFAAIYTGLVAATCLCLLINGFVGFQFAEDCTAVLLLDWVDCSSRSVCSWAWWWCVNTGMVSQYFVYLFSPEVRE